MDKSTTAKAKTSTKWSKPKGWGKYSEKKTKTLTESHNLDEITKSYLNDGKNARGQRPKQPEALLLNLKKEIPIDIHVIEDISML
jgi:hypothetical protein